MPGELSATSAGALKRIFFCFFWVAWCRHTIIAGVVVAKLGPWLIWGKTVGAINLRVVSEGCVWFVGLVC